jgi:hypothetical protein
MLNNLIVLRKYSAKIYLISLSLIRITEFDPFRLQRSDYEYFRVAHVAVTQSGSNAEFDSELEQGVPHIHILCLIIYAHNYFYENL